MEVGKFINSNIYEQCNFLVRANILRKVWDAMGFNSSTNVKLFIEEKLKYE
jgi:hypothetical protein